MVARIVKYDDYNGRYGILIVKNISIEEVKTKITKIKNRFYDEGILEWCIDDVFDHFPEEWEWHYIQTNDVITI